uniref:Uncharacterized protein n=1 Tax=Anopheles farauti TaxID=69004 RepID=A0A182Q1V3_9DIPT
MKFLLAAVLLAVSAVAVLGGPISMSNNNIGDIVKVDVDAEIDIKSEINVELVNQKASVTVTTCRQSVPKLQPEVVESFHRFGAHGKQTGPGSTGRVPDYRLADEMQRTCLPSKFAIIASWIVIDANLRHIQPTPPTGRWQVF